MKKVLSTLLALIMVVSCMAGITFSAAAEETTVDMYGGTSTGNICWSTNGSTTSFGQVFTVAEGKAATGLQLHLGGDNGVALKLNVYRYDSDGILATVATAPLVSKDIASDVNKFATIMFGEALTGSLYWEITKPDGFSGLNVIPYGYNGDVTESADGSVTGIDHVVNGRIGGAFVSWNSASQSFGSKLILDSEATATNTEAQLADAVDLYTGGLAGNIALGNDWTRNSFAQKFTVSSDRKLSVWSHQLATANGGVASGNLSFYKWNTSYSKSVAGAPLYSVDFTVYNNNILRIVLPDYLNLTGELLWVVTNGSNGNITPYGGKGVGTGCIDFVNGTATTASGGSYGLSGWSGAVAFSAQIALTEYHYAPTGEAETVPLFNTVGASQYNGKAKGVVGQSLTVPAGKILTGINIRYMCTEGYSGTATGTFALYQWAGSYAETVSRTPLYSMAVSHSNNQTNITYAIPNTLMVEGAVLWTLTPNADSEQGFAPWGAKDQATGVTSYYNGVAKGLNNYGEYIESTISVIDGGIYAAGETTQTDLYEGDLVYNAALWSDNATATGAGFGQAIALEAGQRLTSFSSMWMVWSGNNTHTVEFFQYAGNALDKNTVVADVAATLATEPLYTATITPVHNSVTTITIPSDVILTGNIMWYIRDPFQGQGKSSIPGGATGYTTNVLNISGGRVQGTATGTTGWSGQLGDKTSIWSGTSGNANTFASWITTESVGYTYINSIDKSIIYSGTMLYQEMYPVSQEAFAAKANRYAEGEWGAWDGTFTQVGNVFYTNHTYDATGVTVDGAATTLDGNNVTVEAAPVKDDAKFLYWSVNGQVATNAPIFKWYPQSATDALVAVYEGEGEAITVPIAPAVKVDRDATTLTVTVTPAHLGGFNITEYGYYISVGTAIDGNNVEGAIKDAAELPTAAYQQTEYNLRPATAAQTIYVVTYVTYMDGETPVTVYGDVVATPAV